MNSQTRHEVRLGLIALALSGLLILIGAALRGPVDFADPGSCCRADVSPAFVWGWTIVLVGLVLQLYGFFGLYRYLTYRAGNLVALLALPLSIGGVVLILPVTSFFAVNGPMIADVYQQDGHEVIAIVEATFTSALGWSLLAVSSVAGLIGGILFAVAIWRDGRLPKWTGVFYALSFVLVVFPLTLPMELLGNALLVVSATAMALTGWRESLVRSDAEAEAREAGMGA